MPEPPDEQLVFARDFPRTHAAITDGARSGLHRGCQIAISKGGRVLASVGLGEAAEGRPMTAGTVNLWRSAGKPMTAAAVLRLVEMNELKLDDPVSRHLPTFADRGVRLIDVLTHTSGLPNHDVGYPRAAWPDIVAAVSQLPRDPASTAAYNYFATWFVLGEIVRGSFTPTGHFRDAIRRAVTEPLRMRDSWNGMTEAEWTENRNRFAVVETITLAGRRREEPLHEQVPCCAASPGSNLRSTARDVIRFYESLRTGALYEKADTLDLMTDRHRDGVMDATFKAPIPMGLGVVLSSTVDEGLPYGFGRWCSARTFGHGGAQCAMAFCDPEHALVVAWAVNGLPGEPRHQQRNAAINSAIYEDLGLTE